MKEISDKLYAKLEYLGIINDENNNVRNHNVGNSDYSEHIIQPWSIWLDYNLNPFDADIIKRVLRNKLGESNKQDYEKIIHICQERIRQIETEIRTQAADIDFENVK
jgi:ABC-type Zn uptake system ZnuABC Zn-binding protein ZnuA